MAESNVAMTRVDFRLVHGQVAARWTRTLAATKIIVIDDGTAKDPFMQKLFSMTAPAGSKIFVYTIKQAIEKWNKNKFGKGPIIVIFKDIASAKKAYDAGFQYESLNIGQVPKAVSRLITRCAFPTKSSIRSSISVTRGWRSTSGPLLTTSVKRLKTLSRSCADRRRWLRREQVFMKSDGSLHPPARQAVLCTHKTSVFP